MGALSCGGETPSESEPAKPIPDGVLAGCVDTDPDGACVFQVGSPLTVWVELPASATPWVLEGATERASTAEGTRWVVHPDVSWRAVTVVSSEGSRRFEIRPADPLPPALTELHSLRDAGEIDVALLRLPAVRDGLPERLQVEAFELEGDLRFLQGDAVGAKTAYAEGATRAAGLTRQHRASAMAQRIAYICTVLEPDEACARRWLEADEGWVAPGSESQVVHDYYRGLFEVRVGARRGAAAAFARVIARASALGMQTLEVGALVERMLLVAEVGDWDAAGALETRAEALAASLPDATGAQLANAIGWMRLQARARGRRDLPEPSPAFERALEMTRKRDAVSRRLRTTLLLNLAYAAVLAGDVEGASEWLDAYGAEPSLHDEERMWGGLLRARVALARGELEAAASQFDAVAGQAAHTPELAWHANVGTAEVLARQGKTALAIERHERAAAVLERELPKIAVGVGRAHYLAERTRGTRAHVRLLLEEGRTEDALCVARRARTRNLRSLAVFDRTDPDVSGALRSYREGRARLEREQEAAWSLAADEAGPRFEALQAEATRLRQALERDVFSRPAPTRPGCSGFRAPAPGEVMLHFFEQDDGWVAFAQDDAGIELRRLGARPSSNDAATLGRWTLSPFASSIERAMALRVMPTGWLHGVRFASLPDPLAPSSPLEARLPVTYGLDVPGEVEHDSSGALVVVPPSNLQAAEDEAGAVLAALDNAETLRGSDATAARVRARLPEVSVVHFVGHAHGDAQGWGGALELAHGEVLDVEAVLALDQVPGTVVLAGCETGRVDEATLAGGMSLAHAFLLVGAEAVLASDDSISDRSTASLMPSFYRGLGAGQSPAQALARARNGTGERVVSAPQLRIWAR